MIVKEKNPVKNPSSKVRQGDTAEKQMSHYLLRAFGDEKDVFVFNDLRIERNGEFAQIDHLVMHPFGFFIVESKSVNGEISVNAHHEFSRASTGIRSPIEQAKMQVALLRALLQDSRESLLKKMLGMLQTSFGGCPMEVCVAISDGGTIKRVGENVEVPELMKADLVCGFVSDEIERHRKANNILRKADGSYGLYKLSPEEQESIRTFLLQSHRGKNADTIKTYLCSSCGSSDLRIQYANTYYFKCGACQGNTPIHNVCASCGNPTRTKKQKYKFSSVCQPCNSERVFFENKIIPPKDT
jgi:hypothetical protein